MGLFPLSLTDTTISAETGTTFNFPNWINSRKKMSKRAEEAARDYVLTSASPFPNTETAAVIYGYTRAEKDTIERSIVWWHDHLVKNFSEGVVAAICEEFRKSMEEEQK